MTLRNFIESRTTDELQGLRYGILLTEAGLDNSLEARAAAYVLDSIERRISHTKHSAGYEAAQRAPLGRGFGAAADPLAISWNLFARSRLPEFLDVLADIKITIALAHHRLSELTRIVPSTIDQSVDTNRLVDLEAIAATLVSASELSTGKTPHLTLARQIANAAGMQQESDIEAILGWLATLVGEAVEIGITQIRSALESASYTMLSEKPTLLYEPVYVFLAILTLADSEGRTLRDGWSPLQLEVWLQIASDALVQVWIEVATLAAHKGTPIPLRNRAAAFEQLRALWTTIVPTEHPAPASTDWGSWPSVSGRPARERAETWDNIAAKLELPRWNSDVALHLYGRKQPYIPGRPRKRVSAPRGTRPNSEAKGPPRSNHRKDTWALPSKKEGDDNKQPSKLQQHTTIRASRPILKRPAGQIPHFPVLGNGDGEVDDADPTTRRHRHHRADDMPTVEIPLDWSSNALPGSVPIALFEPLLSSAEHFVDLDMTRQALTLMMIACPSLYLHPRAFGTIRLHRTAPAIPTAPPGTYFLDLGQGILCCPVDDALTRALARETGVQDSHDGTERKQYWPLILPAELVGWWRLHLKHVADHGVRIEEGCPAIYLQPTPGTAPRPVTGHDLDIYFANRSVVGHGLTASNLLVFAETLVYRGDSPVCPGILCHLTGTYHPRYDAIVPYQRPRHATRRDAARSLCSSVVSELAGRFAGAPPPFDSTAGLGERLLDWIAEGQQAGQTMLTGGDLDARSGSSTVPELSVIARSWHTALDNTIDTIDGNRARRAITTIAELCSGLRWDELRYCQWSDLRPDAEHKLWLRVARKGAGDANRRWMHIPVVGILADLLTAVSEQQTTSRSEVQRIFDDRIDVVRARGSRHAISTFILDHYAELGWKPGDWILAQAQIGHEIEGFPVMRDDEASYAALHHVWAILINHFVHALNEEHQDAPE